MNKQLTIPNESNTRQSVCNTEITEITQGKPTFKRIHMPNKYNPSHFVGQCITIVEKYDKIEVLSNGLVYVYKKKGK